MTEGFGRHLSSYKYSLLKNNPNLNIRILSCGVLKKITNELNNIIKHPITRGSCNMT